MAGIDATILGIIQQFHLCIYYIPETEHTTLETAVSKTRVFAQSEKWVFRKDTFKISSHEQQFYGKKKKTNKLRMFYKHQRQKSFLKNKQNCQDKA